jgi:putative heme-binding domain-containing protein
MIYHDRALPGLHDQYFVCEPSGNLIHRAEIQQDGSVLKLQRIAGEEKSEFGASSDAWSHPMSLTHGPDGSIYVVDYYREIIEDYSAIPRHLQQQYGVYNGHDWGRVYRLTHRDAPVAGSFDMSSMSSEQLARECASPLQWRRQTAQRLLFERSAKSGSIALRELLREKESSTVITALRTMEQLGELTAEDVWPLITHAAPSVRVHALQVSDRWLSSDRELLEKVLRGAESETDARVQIQFALSLGETADSRAVAMLAKYAREHKDVRWMDSAALSSSRARTVALRQIANKVSSPASTATASNVVTEELFQSYLRALNEKRNLNRGHQLFLQACTACHRIGSEGRDVAPDLIGQIAMGEEALLQDILMPNARNRPGFETTIVESADGDVLTGILREEGPTSVTIAQPSLPNETILRKEIVKIQRVNESLMPSFAETLKPDEVADLLAWLRDALGKK